MASNTYSDRVNIIKYVKQRWPLALCAGRPASHREHPLG